MAELFIPLVIFGILTIIWIFAGIWIWNKFKEDSKKNSGVWNSVVLAWGSLFLTIALISITVFYAISTDEMAQIMKADFDSRNRPYIGLEKLEKKIYDWNNNVLDDGSRVNTDDVRRITVLPVLKNFGSVPAIIIKAEQYFLDDPDYKPSENMISSHAFPGVNFTIDQMSFLEDITGFPPEPQETNLIEHFNEKYGGSRTLVVDVEYSDSSNNKYISRLEFLCALKPRYSGGPLQFDCNLNKSKVTKVTP